MNKKIVPMPGMSCYFDMGAFAASVLSEGNAFITNGIIQPALDVYFTSLFHTMSINGQKHIILGFAQLDSIDVYYNPVASSAIDPNDSIAALIVNPSYMNLKDLNSSVVFSNLLNYICYYAHQKRITVTISFGGPSSDPSTSYQIVNLQAGETYQGQVQKLIQFMINTGLDGIDFNFQNIPFVAGTPSFSGMSVDSTGAKFVDFFNFLAMPAKLSNKNVSLTVATATIYVPVFQPIMDNFSCLNLMAYNFQIGTLYYLDPQTPEPKLDWATIDPWIQAYGIGIPQNIQQINIGFQDAVPYASQGANGGWYEEYTIQPGSSNGSAAAQLFNQLQSILNVQLGYPFFYPGANVSSRYVPIAGNASNFTSQFMIDFYESLPE
jgi:hypothetical protein